MLPSPCAGPTDNSHYVDGREARLICGACPSSATSFEDRIKIADALIVGCGVRVFYDLMNDAERKQIGCVDYRGDMDFTLKAHLQAHSADFEEDICFGGEQHKDADNKEQIIYRRYPVKDHHAFSSDAFLIQVLDQLDADYKAGHTIYVHCLGGHGRSGILMTCWLGRRFGLPFKRAFALNNELHAARRNTTKKHACPRLRLQQPQIARVIAGAVFFHSGFLSQWHPCVFSVPVARIVQVFAATDTKRASDGSMSTSASAGTSGVKAGAGSGSGSGGSSSSGEEFKVVLPLKSSSESPASKSKFVSSAWLPARLQRTTCSFKSAEMWMMCCKAVLFQDWDSFDKILKAPTPKACKHLGGKGQLKGFEATVWDKYKFAVVCEGNRLKFGADASLRSSLLETYPTRLFEASSTDAIWGIGMNESSACKRWESNKTPKPGNASLPASQVFTQTGLNLLGQALELVRDELRAAPSSR